MQCLWAKQLTSDSFTFTVFGNANASALHSLDRLLLNTYLNCSLEYMLINSSKLPITCYHLHLIILLRNLIA